MVSPMALICKRYAAGCTKTKTKILRPKNSENGKNAPEIVRKGRNRVRFGCWGGVQPVRTGGKTRNPNQSEPHSHTTRAKRKPAKTQSFRRFCGRGRRTCLGCRLGRRWTVATGDQRPSARTAGEPAGAPCCQILPHTNEKSQVPHKRYLTFLAGAEGLEPSARGFGDRCSTN